MHHPGTMTVIRSGSLPAHERETFFAAQGRHRSGARLWSLAAEAIVGLVGLAICILLAPLGFALIGLALDLVNIVIRMPNLLGFIGDLMDVDHFRWTAPAFAVLCCLPVPGIVLLAIGAVRIRKLLPRDHAELLRTALRARPPNLQDLEEIQLRNVIEEISIAAGRTPPALLLIDDPAVNLGWIGGADQATLVATRGLLDRLGRDATQALVALAIASIGNGDGAMASRLVRTVELVGLLMMMSQVSISSYARRAMKPLFGIGRHDADDATRVALLQKLLSDPWGMPQDPNRPTRSQGFEMTWREWVTLPITGSMMIGVVLIPILSMCTFIPMVGLMWRRRRLLADATAVQFTRYPQALAEAFVAVAPLSTSLGDKSAWLVNLFMFPAAPSPFRMPTPYPPMRLRIERLIAMGAQVTLPDDTDRHMPQWLILALLPIGALLIVLCGAIVVLGSGVSVALNFLFLGLPVGLIHLLLRWIGG